MQFVEMRHKKARSVAGFFDSGGLIYRCRPYGVILSRQSGGYLQGRLRRAVGRQTG
jgi:hypothetical protein